MWLFFILLTLINTYLFFQCDFFLYRIKHYFNIIMLLFLQIGFNISIIIFFIRKKFIVILHSFNILNWILFFYYNCLLNLCILRFFTRINLRGWCIFAFMRNARSWLSYCERFTKIMIMITSLILVCLFAQFIYLNYIISKQILNINFIILA